MAFQYLHITFLLTLLLVSPLSTLSQISPAPSPSPSPSPSQSPSPVSPSFSPPAPLDPVSPSPSADDVETPRDDNDSRAPPPDVTRSGINHENQADSKKNDDKQGMGSGKIVGIVFAVIVGVCIVGIGAIVWRKRQKNIRRAQYIQFATRQFL